MVFIELQGHEHSAFFVGIRIKVEIIKFITKEIQTNIWFLAVFKDQSDIKTNKLESSQSFRIGARYVAKTKRKPMCLKVPHPHPRISDFSKPTSIYRYAYI